MKKKDECFSPQQIDQLHHLLEEQIVRISVEEEEERMRSELDSDLEG